MKKSSSRGLHTETFLPQVLQNLSTPNVPVTRPSKLKTFKTLERADRQDLLVRFVRMKEKTATVMEIGYWLSGSIVWHPNPNPKILKTTPLFWIV